MEVVLQYFDGCPSWVEADRLLRAALVVVGESDATITHRKIETSDKAVSAGFVGSPTILIDGRDPFAREGADAGLACRVYRTPDGLRGSPTLEQLVEAFRWCQGTISGPAPRAAAPRPAPSGRTGPARRAGT